MSNFDDELRKAKSKNMSIDPNATGAVDMQDVLQNQKKAEEILASQMPAEDYVKLREQLDNVMKDIRTRKRINELGLKHYAEQIPEALKQARGILGKIKETVKGKKPTLAAGIIGAGALLAPKGSKAAEVITKIGEAAEKVDPSYYLQRSLEDETEFKKILQKAEDIKQAKKQESEQIKKEVTPMIKELGGEPDIRPEKAIQMVGEKSEEDQIDPKTEISAKEFDKLLKMKLGYR